MKEQIRYELASGFAEMMYFLMEGEYQRNECDLDAMMRRLKDLSAYSLIHAEIMEQREGVELLATAMFFGATSDPKFHKNQERMRLLSNETIAYTGQAKIIEQEVALRKVAESDQRDSNETMPPQPPLF